MYKILIISGVLGLFGMLNHLTAHAAVVEVVNDNKKELEVIIEPGEGTMLPNKQDLRYTLKKGEKRKIEVSEKHFNEDNTFVVTGRVNVPSLYNKCGPMLIDRNYLVVFTPTAAGGTSCYYGAPVVK